MKKYEELCFVDDFMFCKVLTANPDLCRRLLSVLLGRKVKKVIIHGAQQAVAVAAGAKSIRMDVYLEDDAENVYDIEMQTTAGRHLPLRLRYYQAMLDLNHLESGEDYARLPHTVIIFICTFDFFKKQLPVYTFENRCVQEPELALGDRAEKIFINPESRREGVDRELDAFLDYLQGKKTEEGLVGELEREVEKARKRKNWEVEYMTWQAYQMDARREGREEGLEEGRKEGRREGRKEGQEEGETRLGKLISILLAQGKFEDARLVSTDTEARAMLYQKYGIV